MCPASGSPARPTAASGWRVAWRRRSRSLRRSPRTFPPGQRNELRKGYCGDRHATGESLDRLCPATHAGVLGDHPTSPPWSRYRVVRLLGPPRRPVERAHRRHARRQGHPLRCVRREVYPAGFLPLVLGNIHDRPLHAIYRDSPLLRSIRPARFNGRCGRCEYADLCGGSRARAYAASGDPLADDPACTHQPQPV
jgi:radical SAM protein with 4Fe4S-binding SPASM domain